MLRKLFGSHIAVDSTYYIIFWTEGLILCSLERALHGSNCSDLNEFNPCTYQYKYKKSWTDHRNSFLKFKKRLCFSALIGCGYRSICMLQLWSEQIHSCIQTVTHQSRLIWAHRGNWWASSGVSDLGEECVVGGCKPGHAKAGTWRAGKSQQKNWNDFVWLCIDTLTLNFRRTLEQSRDKASKKPVKIPKMSRAGWGGENCGGLWLPYSFLRFSGWNIWPGGQFNCSP